MSRDSKDLLVYLHSVFSRIIDPLVPKDNVYTMCKEAINQIECSNSCKKCHKVLPFDAKFCPECGSNIEDLNKEEHFSVDYVRAYIDRGFIDVLSSHTTRGQAEAQIIKDVKMGKTREQVILKRTFDDKF